MKKRRTPAYIMGKISVICILMILLCSGNAAAVERDELRLNAGLDMFLSLLSADLDITKKQGNDGFLTLLLIYNDNKRKAQDLADTLGSLKKIREIPIRVEITDDITMSSYMDNPPAGIFITQPLGKKLPELIQYSVNKGIILFSPFRGDVEKGVLGGIHITDRVLPYVNSLSIKSSGIRIKKFFLRVSEIYGS